MKEFGAVGLAIIMLIVAGWLSWTIDSWRASFSLQPQVDQLKVSNNAMERIASSLETIASNIHRIDRQGEIGRGHD